MEPNKMSTTPRPDGSEAMLGGDLEYPSGNEDARPTVNTPTGLLFEANGHGEEPVSILPDHNDSLPLLTHDGQILFPPRSEIVWPDAPRLSMVDLPEEDLLSPIEDDSISDSLPVPFPDVRAEGLQLELEPSFAYTRDRRPVVLPIALDNQGLSSLDAWSASINWEGVIPFFSSNHRPATRPRRTTMTIMTRRGNDLVITPTGESYVTAEDLERALIQWMIAVDQRARAVGRSAEFSQLWDGPLHDGVWVTITICFWRGLIPYSDADNAWMLQE